MRANFEILQLFERMELDISFEQLIPVDSGLMCYSSINTSPFQNHVLVNSVLTEEQILEIERVCKTHNRKSAIFFEKRQDLEELEKSLILRGYKKEWEDSWMFYEGNDVDTKNFQHGKEVQTLDELHVFLHIFDQSFQKDDPLNPYGDVKGFLAETESAWKKFAQSKRVQYFVFSKQNEPVAVSALNNFENTGYISCVGSLSKVRGQGYGKLATLFALNQSMKNNNTDHFLATEAGTNPHMFYTHLGFQTRFLAPGYTKGE